MESLSREPGDGRRKVLAIGRDLGGSSALRGLSDGARTELIHAENGNDGLRAFYDRTLGFQADRGSPFSLWGLYDLPGRTLALAAALLFAVAVAFVPRRRDPVAVAALGAATLIVLQLALEHWFYLYLVWFLPLVFVALVSGRRIDSIDAAPDEPGDVRMTTAISHGSTSEAS